MSSAPTYLTADSETAFAWWHAPTSAYRSTLVMFGTAGYDEMCSHWAMARLAERLAREGHAVLRVDLIGTGDSGDAKDGDVVAGWKRTVPLAIDAAKRLASVSTVGVVGLRLGATVAAQLGSDRQDIAALALIDPVVQGRAWFREQKALALTSGIGIGASSVDVQEDGGVDVLGYRFTQQTQTALSTLDLLALKRAPAPHVLYLPRADRGADARFVAALEKLEAQVTTVPGEGLAALFQDAVSSKEPEADFAQLTQWLNGQLPQQPTAPAPTPTLTPRHDADGYTEEATVLGGAKHLATVGCFPKSPSGPALLVLNTGANHRVGSHRTSVMLMRTLAKEGVASARVDVGGIGDTPARAGQKTNFPYNLENVSDLRDVLDWLERKGHHRFVATGICSGGYNSFHLALADTRVRGVISTNAQRFAQVEDLDLDLVIRRTAHATQYYQQRLRDPETYKRLLRGEIHVRTLAPVLAGRLWHQAKTAAAVRINRTFGSRFERDPVARGFLELLERGVRLAFVLSSDDGARDELAKHVGAQLERLGDRSRVFVEVLDGADHTLTQRWAQAQLLAVVRRVLAEVT